MIGFASGVLSGMFGIGGGILTTPAIRLILKAPAMVAVGTPLPVIIPSAATGAFQYLRHKTADLRTGITIGLSGAVTAVLGAFGAEKVGGTVVLIGTAALILYAAGDMIEQIWRHKPAVQTSDEFARAQDFEAAERDAATGPTLSAGAAVVMGAVAGLYSGFFGLGGGFVLVPLLGRWGRMPMKRAIGTSLVAVTLLAIPGTFAHSLAGNIDWRIALAMMIGVVPGSLIGVRLTLGTADRVLRVAFVGLLVVSAGWLAAAEWGLLR